MKRSIIFDRTGKCKGCEFESPGPSKILSTSSCTWCERNPYLITEITDQYKKMKLADDYPVDNSSLPEDTNPAGKANKEFLQEYGIQLNLDPKKTKKTPKINLEGD